MLKKMLTIGCVVVLLGFISNSSNSASAISQEDSSNYKLIMGSIFDIADVTRNNFIHETPHPYLAQESLQLYGDSSDQYIDKQRIKTDVPVLNRIIEQDPSQFSDLYYDPEEGKVVVQITNESGQLKNLVKNSISNADKIEFEVIEFSKKDILDANEIIKENSTEGLVTALIPDVKKNKLIIALKEDSSEQDEQDIRALLPKPDMIEFTRVSSDAFKVESDDTHYGYDIPMGSK